VKDPNHQCWECEAYFSPDHEQATICELCEDKKLHELASLRSAVKEYDAAESAIEERTGDHALGGHEDDGDCPGCKESAALFSRAKDARVALRKLAKEIG